MTVGRRALLRSIGAAGAAALAGCLGDDALVRVLNDTDATLTVTTTIRDRDAGETMVEETFELPPAPEDDPDEGSRVHDDAVEDGPTYEVTVAVRDGPAGTDEYGGLGRLWAVIEVDEVDFQNVD